MQLHTHAKSLRLCFQQVDAWSRIAKKYGLHDYYPPVQPPDSHDCLLHTAHESEFQVLNTLTKHATNSSLL